MPRWLLLDTGPRDGAWNMACDVALMARARSTGDTVLRVYGWEHPTLSFGRHEAARRHYDANAIRAARVELVRRPTGGRALLHHREVTYSITAPLRDDVALSTSVRAFNQLLLRALRALGVPATEADAPRALRPEGAACFAVPSAGELTLGTQKLVGSAQVRQDGALLQHGSILLDDDQGMIAGFTHGAYVAPAPAASLRSVLGASATYAVMRDALFQEATRDGGDADVLSADTALSCDDAFADALSLFRNPDWTWRR